MLIYPELALKEGQGFPLKNDLVVAEREPGKGRAVYTHRGHRRGEFVGRFTGPMVPYRTQHTLQVNPNLHVLDLHFIGYLAHSCAPNIFLDMQAFEVWALTDIAPESALTMDYASTEDELFKQFPCLCGAPNCRHWITGRKEQVSDEGQLYLDQLQTRREAC